MEHQDVQRFEEFLKQFYEKDILSAAQQGKKSFVIDFSLLEKFDFSLADRLLDDPVAVLEAVQEAVKSIDLPESAGKITPRFKNLPEKQNIRIRNLRSEHIGKFICLDGIVRRASEVKPDIAVAVFECSECGTKMPIKQTDRMLKPPYACEKETCHSKQFEMTDKELIDTRWIVLEEPFETATAEKPGQINVFLKEDLNTPELQRKADPGNRLKIVGTLKELRRLIKGKTKTQMDIFLEANQIEPLEIEWEEINITKEDEKTIKQMASDPMVYEKIVGSIAPSMYGLSEIKEAIALQLFSGVPRQLPDGTRLRGDIHILLVGDPAIGKSVVGSSKVLYKSDKGCGWVNISELVDNTLKNKKKNNKGTEMCFSNPDNVKVLTLNIETHKMEWKNVYAFIRHETPKRLIKIKTRNGREIIATKDHSFLILNSDGNIKNIRGDLINKNIYVPIPIGTHLKSKEFVDMSDYIKIHTNAKHLPSQIELNWNFGFFLGMFISEGSVSGGAIYLDSYSQKQKDIASNFLNSIGLNTYDDGSRLISSSRNFISWLKSECFSGDKIGTGKGSYSKIKTLPDFCYFAPDEFIFGLFSGLFSGDGYYINAISDKWEGNLRVAYSTTSKNLAFGILDILALKGIFAHLHSKKYVYKDREGMAYEIELSGREAEKFLKNSKLVDKEKTIERFSKSDALDSIPCGDILYEIVKSLGYSRRNVENSKIRRAFAAMMRTVRKRNRIGRRRLERIYDILIQEAERQTNIKAKNKLEIIKKLLDSDVRWDKVVSVKEVDPEDKYVYDLSIEGNENFVANGIVVHNTQILKLISKIIPRGRYVSGKGVTGVGLTCSVTKDEELMGGWVLEAGAMVLCHKGLIAIDEFDKMNKDDQIAMHEAMSVQTISVAKASIIATLPAQTSVLAAANPKHGRFDPLRSIVEEIDIPETLLSRFDAKFLIRDIPSREMDEKLADYVIEARQNPETVKPVITPSFLRKYIAYARYNCSPQITDEAKEKIKEFYLYMRGLYGGSQDVIAITLRQYEALLRLSEASARIRLSGKVEVVDAERAIKIMKYSIQQLGYDQETGKIDIDRTEGTSASQRSKIHIVLDLIDMLEKKIGKPVPKEEIIAAAEEQGVKEEDVEELLRRLKIEGSIFEPKLNYIERIR